MAALAVMVLPEVVAISYKSDECDDLLEGIITNNPVKKNEE